MNHRLQLETPAGPRQVWRALTAPELTTRYLYGMAATSTWTAGAGLRLAGADGNELSGEVLAAAEPSRLSYTLEAGAGQPSTYVTWEIWPAGRGAVVQLVVDEPDDLMSDEPGPEAAAAWAGVLANLGAVLASAAPEPAVPPFAR